MELEDVILSTLAEMQKTQGNGVILENITSPREKKINILDNKVEKNSFLKENDVVSLDNQIKFLNPLRERLLVLFEGLQSPNNENIEAKLDMTLNFLEYALANIDSKIIELEKENQSESI